MTDQSPGADWTPPATVGGTWARVREDGIFETWPAPDFTRCETVFSDRVKALLGTTYWAGNRTVRT
jgi:hypothetical protein